MSKEPTVLKYGVFSLRLDERTKKKLIEGKQNAGLSWNRYILTLVDIEYKNKLDKKI